MAGQAPGKKNPAGQGSLRGGVDDRIQGKTRST